MAYTDPAKKREADRASYLRRRASNRLTAESRRAERRRYYLKHREEILAKQNIDYEKNREKKLAGMKAYAQRNRDKLLRYYATYYAEHREERRIKDAARAAKNREKIRRYRRQWRAANRDKIAVYQARYYAKNREAQAEKQRRYRGAHPEIMLAQVKRRRALRMNAPINDFTADQWLEIQVAYGHRCVYCPADCKACKKKTHKLTQDHITPLSKGGPNTASNIVPACKSHNSKKYNGPPLCPVQPLLVTVAPRQPYKAG